MNPTRRRFLGTSLAAPALVTAIQPAASAAPPLRDDERAAMRIAMDLIIPAGDGMPSATDAGGMGYVERLLPREPGVAAQLTQSLAVVEAYSARSYDRPFRQLSHTEQVFVLKDMEATAPAQFVTLRDLIYESYYTQPEIWKRIGYELYPTDHTGPHMAPFDEALIEDVRKRGKLYREA